MSKMKTYIMNISGKYGGFAPLIILALFGWTILLLVAAVGLSYALFSEVSSSTLGTSGDYFGGFANPILSFMAFLGVLYSIYLQQTSLRENQQDTQRQIATLERQNIETTFFSMLKLYDSIVNSTDTNIKRTGFDLTGKVNSSVQHIKGRDCFTLFAERLQNTYIKHKKDRMGDTNEESIIEDAYSDFYGPHRQDLGHYFRFLFNTIRYIDDQSQRKDLGIPRAEFEKYMKILRAQLSDQELVLLFYNCLHGRGKDFAKYAKQFELFDNLPRELLFDPSHVYSFPQLGPVDSPHKA